MIAVWMAYTLLAGTLVALGCWLLERAAAAARLPTRWVWVGGMAAMLAIGAAGMRPEERAPALNPVDASAGAATASTGDGAAPSTAGARVAGLRLRIERLSASVAGAVDGAARSLSGWDRVLLGLWAVSAAFLSGVVAHAALEGLRLRGRLQPEELAGAPVLLTDHIGPSAIGIGGPAILIPQWVLDLDDALVQLVVRHEREHLAARDPILLLAALVGIVLIPWHLPLWWSRARLRLAIEVDCDRRVLHAHPDVRRYGQLLLLTAQRSIRPAWPDRAVVTVVAPLQPAAAHLARRLSSMNQPRRSRILLRALPLIVGAAAAASLVAALPAPRGVQAQASVGQTRAVVHLTTVGIRGVQESMSLVVYAPGPARFGIGTDPPVPLADTVRLAWLPAMTADVTDSDVHIELRSPGTISVGGEVTGGPARTVSATGRHLILLKGGRGIRHGF
jgi:beta-lactamase regulating signal transducer with metallopeptidase domain